MSERRYVPAAGRAWLTPLFDPVLGVTTRERRWRTRLVDEAARHPARILLDVGCGTGTLAIQLARRLPSTSVIGLDGDPAILARAAGKTNTAGVKVKFIRALADAIPLGDRTVDCALSSLVFHHFDLETKQHALSEIHRVLVPGGRLLICDYGQPHDPLMRGAFLSVQILDGFSNTRLHADGELPRLIRQAGFTARPVDRLRTMTGTIELWQAEPG